MESSVVAVGDRANEIKPKIHFTGTVTKITLAGAIVDIGVGIPGLIHISQIPTSEDGQPVKRVEDALSIGQQVEVWVRKVKEGRIELTMTKPLDLEWRDIKKGMTVKGKVTRLEKFGAFVEIGAERPGLIHISELAHGYVRTPGDVVKEGDEVEAQVLDVNRRKKQIKLSLKALQEEPVKEEEPVHPAEFTPKEKPNRRRKSKGEDRSAEGRAEGGATYHDTSTPAETVPTAMEIALREAMERAKVKKQSEKLKRTKGANREQEDILSRTLEHKVRTS
ncbi:MAG TPA: S1 RNA-binding domain-containing protein [Anaerolineaceae bacterium]|nr:S1 RNA-binding domain-containing protein [Anaerolineaceae bacterium]